MSTFGIATNACLADAVRLRHTVPSWLRSFGERLTEVVIMVDEQPVSGRIAANHGQAGGPEELHAELDRLRALDRRIRCERFDPAAGSDSIARKWFGDEKPLRCQGGTPILAFVATIEAARANVVLRTDCDMLFHEAGWLARADELVSIGAFDLVEPPRPGYHATLDRPIVSTRALVIRPREFATRHLPMRAHGLDPLRSFQRRLRGRPRFLALEQMFDREVELGRMHHVVLDGGGFSLHVGTRRDAALPWFPSVVDAVERGQLASDQRTNWDFNATAWPY
jgi:hypothetical protein